MEYFAVKNYTTICMFDSSNFKRCTKFYEELFIEHVITEDFYISKYHIIII